MVSLPIAHEQEQEAAGVISATCPYSAAEMASYLASGHYHYLTAEPEAEFSVGANMVAADTRDGRAYWVRDANDTLGREWFVLIGSGRSPFDPAKFMSRWMLAETNDDLGSPDDFLRRQIAEQTEHDLRKPMAH